MFSWKWLEIKYVILKASRIHECILNLFMLKLLCLLKDLISILDFMLYMFRFIIFNYIFWHILIGNLF